MANPSNASNASLVQRVAASLRQEVRHCLLAVQFFTRIPVTGRLADWVGFSPALLRASAAHFPGVGWVVGLAAAAVSWALLSALLWAGHSVVASGALAAVLSTLATVWLTGAFHEDGLADVADGLGGTLDRDRALDIMKDSRVGAFGALALVLAVASKVALLTLLADRGTGDVAAAMVVAHVLSRFAPLWLIRHLPHVGDTATSKSKPLADQITGAAMARAVLWTCPALLVAWWCFGPVGLAGVAVAGGVAAFAMYRLFRRRLQGFTGDCLGATQQVCEQAVYLALALLPLSFP